MIIKNQIVCFIIYLFFVYINCKSVKVDIDSKYGGNNIDLNNFHNYKIDNSNNNNNNNNNLYLIKKDNKCINIPKLTRLENKEEEEYEEDIKKVDQDHFFDRFKSSKCQFKKEKEFKRSLKEYFSNQYILFQDDAISEVKLAITRKFINPKSKLVLHLFGDQGVGKTETSQLISRVLFKLGSGIKGDGLFTINCQEYLVKQVKDSESNNQVALYQAQLIHEHRTSLYNKVLAQLDACPYSVILLDEIQKINPDIISVLEPIFDGDEILWYGPSSSNLYAKKVDTSLATFILTSDFGLEGRAKGLTRQESREKAVNLFKSIYDGIKLSNLVTESIPFVSLTPDVAHQTITQQIIKLFCKDEKLDALIIRDVDFVSSIVYDYYKDIHANENFRGIEKSINYYITNYISTFYIKKYDKIKNQFNQIKMTLIIEPNNNNNNNNNNKNRLNIDIVPSN